MGPNSASRSPRTVPRGSYRLTILHQSVTILALGSSCSLCRRPSEALHTSPIRVPHPVFLCPQGHLPRVRTPSPTPDLPRSPDTPHPHPCQGRRNGRGTVGGTVGDSPFRKVRKRWGRVCSGHTGRSRRGGGTTVKSEVRLGSSRKNNKSSRRTNFSGDSVECLFLGN